MINQKEVLTNSHVFRLARDQPAYCQSFVLMDLLTERNVCTQKNNETEVRSMMLLEYGPFGFFQVLKIHMEDRVARVIEFITI